MAFHSTKLKNPKYPNVAQERKNRLKKILEQDKHEYLCIEFAEQYLRSYKLSPAGIWMHIKLHYFPGWLYWLVDKDYRAACSGIDKQELEDFERDMRELFSKTENK